MRLVALGTLGIDPIVDQSMKVLARARVQQVELVEVVFHRIELLDFVERADREPGRGRWAERGAFTADAGEADAARW